MSLKLSSNCPGGHDITCGLSCRDTFKDLNNSAAGQEILTAATTRLLLHYRSMLEPCKRSGGDGLALAGDAVTVKSFMYDVMQCCNILLHYIMMGCLQVLGTHD